MGAEVKPGEPLVLHPRPGWKTGKTGGFRRPFVALFAGWALGAWAAWLMAETIPGWRSFRITVWPALREAARRISPFLVRITAQMDRCALVSYGAAFVFLAILFLLWRVFNRKSILLTVLLGIALGMGGAFRHMGGVRSISPWLGREIRCEGRVGLSANYEEERDVYPFRVTQVFMEDGQSVPVHLSLRLEIKGEDRVRYQPGDRLAIHGTWQAPPGASNPGGFDYRHSLMADGVGGILRVEPDAVARVGNSSIVLRAANAVRLWMDGVYDRYAGDQGASLMQAMMLGERWRLSDEVYTGFIETGMAHILAISGLHVGFLAGCLYWAFRQLRLGPKTVFFCLLVILPFYALLTGAGVSILLATVTILITAGGRALGRRPDLLNNLCVAALCVFVIRPLDILDIGFQLSFSAISGLILLTPLLRRPLAFLPFKIGDLIAVSLAAQLGVSPVLAWHFYGIAPASLAANLFLVPLSGMMVNLGFLLPLISWMPYLPEVLGFVLNISTKLMLWINGTAAHLLGYRYIPSPGWVFLAGHYLTMLFLSGQRPRWAKNRWPWAAGVAALTALLLILMPVADNRFIVVFADVGQGACVYIRTPDEAHLLVDAGGNIYGGDYDPGASRVAPFLLSNGVGKLDLLIASHAHEDHIGGMPAVLDRVGADRFAYYPPEEPDASWPLIWESLSRSKIPVQPLTEGDALPLGDWAVCRVLYPPAAGPANSEENNRSLCLLISYREASVLLTGDIEAAAEVAVDWPRADIVQMPHHGSKTSSSAAWIEAVSPMAAVAQAGPNNPYDHPSPEALARYQAAGIAVFRNDLDGAVVCEYGGGEWTVYSVKGEALLEH